MSGIVFTVIIPYHLSEQGDRRPLMNRLARSLPDRADLEVLWINDRSTLPWMPPGAHHTQHKTLHSPAGRQFSGPARNLGIAQARGRWLLFCDSDDATDTQSLNLTLEKVLADEHTHTAADLYVSPSFAVDEKENPVNDLYVNTLWKRAYEEKSPLHLVYHYAPWSKIIKKSFAEEHGLFFGNQKAGQDAVFSSVLALKNPRTVFMQDPWYIYTVPESNRKISKQAVQGCFQAHRFVQAALKKHGKDNMRAGGIRLAAKCAPHAPWTTLIESAHTLLSGDFFGPPSTLAFRIKRRLMKR